MPRTDTRGSGGDGTVNAMNETLFASAVDAIYDAAVTPELWDVALERLGGIFGCKIATLIDRNIRTSQGHGVAVGVDAASQIEFFAVWGKRNPFVQALRRVKPNAIDTDRDILPRSALVMSDYYNGFMRQRDMHALLRFTLQKDADTHQSLSLMRPRSAGDFEDRDVSISRMFLPHLQRSAKLTRHLTVAMSLVQSVHDGLESHPDGIVLVNRSSGILFANRAARAMAAASDSFVLRGNRIAAVHGRDNGELQRLIAGATRQAAGIHHARGDAMRLARSGGERDYVATVVPLPGRSALSEKLVPAACIIMTDPARAPRHSPAMLKSLFDLSPTEARMAERLAYGETPEQAAAVLNIGISTARTHINAIYRKTDVNRQSELIRLLAKLSSTAVWGAAGS